MHNTPPTLHLLRQRRQVFRREMQRVKTSKILSEIEIYENPLGKRGRFDISPDLSILSFIYNYSFLSSSFTSLHKLGSCSTSTPATMGYLKGRITGFINGVSTTFVFLREKWYQTNYIRSPAITVPASDGFENDRIAKYLVLSNVAMDPTPPDERQVLISFFPLGGRADRLFFIRTWTWWHYTALWWGYGYV